MIDAKGRVFGLINAIDLAIALSIVFLAALGVRAYRVFQIPAPVIERVEPAAVAIASGQRVRVVGRNFRHYLHVFASPTGRPFAVTPTKPDGPEIPVDSVTDAQLELRLPEMPAGSYDIYVFDNARQLAHLPSALKLIPPDPPRATIRLLVRLLLSPETAGQLHVGDRDLPAAANAATAVVQEPAEIEKLDIRPDRVDVMDMRVATEVPGDDHYLWMGTHTSQVIVDAVLQVPLIAATPERWEYKGRTVRAGEGFLFQTSSTRVVGLIVHRDEPEVARR